MVILSDIGACSFRHFYFFMTVSSAENLKLSRVLSFKHGMGQNTAMHCEEFCDSSFLFSQFVQLHFPQSSPNINWRGTSILKQTYLLFSDSYVRPGSRLTKLLRLNQPHATALQITNILTETAVCPELHVIGSVLLQQLLKVLVNILFHTR